MKARSIIASSLGNIIAALILTLSAFSAETGYEGTRTAASVAKVVYHISPKGTDEADGKSSETAWKTLAHACDVVPAGNHLIRLSSGTFEETRPARPKAGVMIAGNGNEGDKTIIKAPPAWDFTADKCKNAPEGYLIVIENQNSVSVRGIEFVNDPGHRANGAIYSMGSDGTVIDRIAAVNFRYAGVYLEKGENLIVSNSRFSDSAGNFKCDASNLGNITARYIRDSKFHNNVITDTRGGYGYRGRSQTNVEIYRNHICTRSFAMELAHEVDERVRIYENDLSAVISVPRFRGSPPKNFPYTIRIHNNISSSAYGGEGTRNHLEIDHNYFYGEQGDARIYTDYGNNNSGPVWIHHNVAVSCRGFFFSMGKDKNYFIHHNTVILGENYKGSAFEFYKAEGTSDVSFRNNILITRGDKPRNFVNSHGITVENMEVSNNIFHNISGFPEGNNSADPQLTLQGERPFPYYTPTRAGGPLAAKAAVADEPSKGQRSEIGAYPLKLESADLIGLPPGCVTRPERP